MFNYYILLSSLFEVKSVPADGEIVGNYDDSVECEAEDHPVPGFLKILTDQ